MMTFDAFALAGAIARETSSLRITVGPLAIGVRTPAALALGAASVAMLGGRGANLALGASTPVVVSQWHGRRWEPSGMVAAMRDNVAAIRTILAGKRSASTAGAVRTNGFRLAGGAAPANITIAAFGPAMLRLAAEIADRVVVNLVTPAQARRVRAAVDQAASSAGRPAPPLAAWIPVALEPDGAAYDQLARQLVVYLAPPGYGEMFIEAGFGEVVELARSGVSPREVLAAVPHELARAIGAIGDESEIRNRLADYREAGVDEIGVVPVTAHDPGGVHLLRSTALGIGQR
jgi:probable F420-dependent oxidoreductase